MKNIKHKVKKIISEIMNIDIKKIKKTTHLFKDLNVDSLDIIEIAMAIETKFKLEIPDEHLEALNTVDIIIKYIEKNLILHKKI